MPNNITNKLIIKGENKKVQEVLNFIKIEKEDSEVINGIGTIDFNKITPMPKWVYGSNSNVNGISRKDEEKYAEENTCIKWSRKNWGTKWNAYSQGDKRNTENTIYFQTAWNGVPSLISKIAWIFTDVVIEYSWADEDFGHNVARFKFNDTEVLEEYAPDGGTKEAYELAFEITQSTPEDHDLVFNSETNTYEWQEDEEE